MSYVETDPLTHGPRGLTLRQALRRPAVASIAAVFSVGVPTDFESAVLTRTPSVYLMSTRILACPGVVPRNTCIAPRVTTSFPGTRLAAMGMHAVQSAGRVADHHQARILVEAVPGITACWIVRARRAGSQAEALVALEWPPPEPSDSYQKRVRSEVAEKVKAILLG